MDVYILSTRRLLLTGPHNAQLVQPFVIFDWMGIPILSSREIEYVDCRLLVWAELWHCLTVMLYEVHTSRIVGMVWRMYWGIIHEPVQECQPILPIPQIQPIQLGFLRWSCVSYNSIQITNYVFEYQLFLEFECCQWCDAEVGAILNVVYKARSTQYCDRTWKCKGNLIKINEKPFGWIYEPYGGGRAL